MQEDVGQPWRLERRIDDVSEKLRVLALKNYHVFVQSQQCSQVVASDLKSLRGNVQIVDMRLPELQSQCKQLDTAVHASASKNAEIQYILGHYDELMDLLEIPQLIEACIANDLLEEALESIQFAKKIFDQTDSSKGSPANTILHTLVKEVHAATDVLRQKIVEKLRGDLSLAKCLHMVAYLRRVDGLWKLLPVDYNQQLKVEFLSCRDSWLFKTMQSIPTSDPYNFLMQLIDAKRSSWFDMVTQYSAIFGHQEMDGHIDQPLCAWAIRTVSELTQILSETLPKLADFGAVANVMEQVLFFGGSLGRVGVDFRGIVFVQFQNHLVETLSTQWRDVVDEFDVALGAYSSKQSTTPVMLASFRNLTTTTDDTSPPHVIMAFPVLAQLTNGFLNSFNNLRLCALVSLEYRLSQLLQSAMVRVIDVLARFCQQHGITPEADVSSDGLMKKAPIGVQIHKLAMVLQTDWIPFIHACFHKLFTRHKGLPTALDMDALMALLREKRLVLEANETAQVDAS
ncbi:conserved oligomeric Golgi complex component [Aphanomyces cochlioides]|nr:conserved oligomeric Golgi complex component [Aphanomyces cochlioides]